MLPRGCDCTWQLGQGHQWGGIDGLGCLGPLEVDHQTGRSEGDILSASVPGDVHVQMVRGGQVALPEHPEEGERYDHS
jgi:hypothetical protein